MSSKNQNQNHLLRRLLVALVASIMIVMFRYLSVLQPYSSLKERELNSLAEVAQQEMLEIQQRERDLLRQMSYTVKNEIYINSIESQLQSQSRSQSQLSGLQEGEWNENGKNVIAYSLYGEHDKYMNGAISNCKLAKIYYPGWIVRFYISKNVPLWVVTQLQELQAEIIPIPTETENARSNLNVSISVGVSADAGKFKGTFWRFLVATDVTVSRYLLRDVDSRLNAREAAAVREWIASDLDVHIMRDHPTHCQFVMLSGMWGGKGGGGKGVEGSSSEMTGIMKDAIYKWSQSQINDIYGSDQTFLEHAIYPHINSNSNSNSNSTGSGNGNGNGNGNGRLSSLEHDSHCCEKFPHVKPFPSQRLLSQFVGQSFNSKHHVKYDRYALQQVPLQCRKHLEDIYG